jgi:hypothetical protein
MKGTLKMAQTFEDGIGILWDGKDKNQIFLAAGDGYRRVHSCPTIPYYGEEYYYISRIAPGLVNSFSAFGENTDADALLNRSRSFREKIQLQRALWLTLLAEVAERGEEF